MENEKQDNEDDYVTLSEIIRNWLPVVLAFVFIFIIILIYVFHIDKNYKFSTKISISFIYELFH